MPKRLFEMVTGDSSGYSQSKQSRSSVGNATSTGKSKVYRKSKGGSAKGGLAKYIKAVIQNTAEKKQALTGIAATLNNAQTVVTLVSGMSQGATGSNRVGDEINYVYFEVNIAAYNSVITTSTPPNGDCGFWSLILDRQPNGALAAFADIYDDSVGGISGLDFRTSLKNADRFLVLKTEEWSIGCGYLNTAGTYSTLSGAEPYKCKSFVDMRKKGNDAKESFNAGTTGAITAIDSNAVLFVWASTLTTTNNNTNLLAQVKCRYTDM